MFWWKCDARLCLLYLQNSCFYLKRGFANGNYRPGLFCGLIASALSPNCLPGRDGGIYPDLVLVHRRGGSRWRMAGDDAWYGSISGFNLHTVSSGRRAGAIVVLVIFRLQYG
ncbi:hypothetical protein KCP75_06150 [Salmonella enterica subsp. enterica]|nr:hypothetical protein KCP75_06150 [Salmonella enterica subsp. enterica]